MKLLTPVFFILAVAQHLPAAPAWESVYAFSELKNVPFEKLAQGEVIGARTALDGSELSLGAESFYTVAQPPSEVLKRMSTFTGGSNSSSGETLDVNLHLPVSTPPKGQDFSKFILDPEAKGSRWFLNQSFKSLSGQTGFNLSSQETERLATTHRKNGLDQKPPADKAQSEKIAQEWRELFSLRAAAFQKAGLLGSAPYESDGHRFDPAKETLRALKSRPKLLQAFAAVLDPVMSGRPIPGGRSPHFYWESSSVQGEQTISLSAQFSQPLDDGFRVAEVSYYVTGQYYISVILYQLIPADVNGTKGTFIYRSDFVLTPSVSRIKGIERIAAENILLLEIKKSARSFVEECNGAKRQG